MTECELELLKEDELWDKQQERRLANRSAEEVLMDIEEEFDAEYGETLEKFYNRLEGELRDYGLDSSTNDIIMNILENNTRFVNSKVKLLEKQLANCRKNFVDCA